MKFDLHTRVRRAVDLSEARFATLHRRAVKEYYSHLSRLRLSRAFFELSESARDAQSRGGLIHTACWCRRPAGMSSALAVDRRARGMRAIRGGMSRRPAAARFGVCAASAGSASAWRRAGAASHGASARAKTVGAHGGAGPPSCLAEAPRLVRSPARRRAGDARLHRRHRRQDNDGSAAWRRAARPASACHPVMGTPRPLSAPGVSAA
jgi:hypothetical protein